MSHSIAFSPTTSVGNWKLTDSCMLIQNEELYHQTERKGPNLLKFIIDYEKMLRSLSPNAFYFQIFPTFNINVTNVIMNINVTRTCSPEHFHPKSSFKKRSSWHQYEPCSGSSSICFEKKHLVQRWLFPGWPSLNLQEPCWNFMFWVIQTLEFDRYRFFLSLANTLGLGPRKAIHSCHFIPVAMLKCSTKRFWKPEQTFW